MEAGRATYQDAPRDLVTWAAVGRVRPPVELSWPMVETNLLESPAGAVVPLANWTMAPIANLDVIANGVARASSVVSIKRGRIAFRRQGDTIRLRLPLASTDMLLIRYAAKTSSVAGAERSAPAAAPSRPGAVTPRPRPRPARGRGGGAE